MSPAEPSEVEAVRSIVSGAETAQMCVQELLGVSPVLAVFMTGLLFGVILVFMFHPATYRQP